MFGCRSIPPLDDPLFTAEFLSMLLAEENRSWGYRRIQTDRFFGH